MKKSASCYKQPAVSLFMLTSQVPWQQNLTVVPAEVMAGEMLIHSLSLNWGHNEHTWGRHGELSWFIEELENGSLY